MKTTAQLSASEIKDALREYVENKTGGTVPENGISLSFYKAQDARETDEISASVKFET